MFTGTFSSVWTFGSHNVSSVPGMADDDGEYQWWYDLFVSVDPTDSTGNTVYIGGVDIWKTTNGGTGWSNMTDVYGTNPVNVHPDEHAIAFMPSSASFYIGNDGGIWSVTGAGTFTNLNSNLNITQFYGGSMSEVGGFAQLYGGTQDNGTAQYPNDSGGGFVVHPHSDVGGVAQWNEVLGGDGGNTVVDYTNNAVIYASNPGGSLWKSIDAGTNWAPADYSHDGFGFPGDTNFVMPLIESPTNHDELLAGSDRVYRTTNGSTAWTAISPQLDPYLCNSGTCYAPISALAVAPSHDATIYVGDDWEMSSRAPITGRTGRPTRASSAPTRWSPASPWIRAIPTWPTPPAPASPAAASTSIRRPMPRCTGPTSAAVCPISRSSP